MVARLPSKFGTLLVFDDGPWRCLAFNTRRSVQSCRHRQHPLSFRYEYVPMMFAAALARPAARRVVVLGLGGAALPQLFHHYRPAAVVDTVEIDPAVVKAANRWFGYRARATEKVYVEDAARFVQRPALRGRYDLVLLDCYGEHFIPAHLQRRAFLRGVRSLLTPRGAVVSNIWQTHPRYRDLVRQYVELFPQVWILPGHESGNAMVIASRAPLFRHRDALIKRALRLEARSRPLLPPLVPHLRRLKRAPR